MKFARLGAAVLAATVFVAVAGGARATVVPRSFGPAAANAEFAPMAVPPDETAAAAYCKSTGGRVEYRIPEFGTNSTSALVLAGSAYFCVYSMTASSNTTHIHLLLTTLYAKKPTLAALAYYAKVKFDQKTCPGGASPGSCYCTQLGASDQFGGATIGGGAWVSKGTVDTDLDACIFPDLSSIDSYGLFYHSIGDIRGIDLAKVLRYKGTKG
jgi:hypothetical protein